MKTAFLLQQHCRCEAILEMIQKCEGRILDYRKRIEYIEKNNLFTHQELKTWLLERWQITLEMKQRLAKSYANQLAKIVKPTIDKIIAPAVTEA
jgi:hypothetical protein